MWCLMWCLLRRLVGAGRTRHIHQLKSSGEGKGSLHRFTFRRGRSLTWRWCAGAVVTSKATTPSSTPMDCCRMSPKEQSIAAVGARRPDGRGVEPGHPRRHPLIEPPAPQCLGLAAGQATVSGDGPRGHWGVGMARRRSSPNQRRPVAADVLPPSSEC